MSSSCSSESETDTDNNAENDREELRTENHDVDDTDRVHQVDAGKRYDEATKPAHK